MAHLHLWSDKPDVNVNLRGFLMVRLPLYQYENLYGLIIYGSHILLYTISGCAPNSIITKYLNQILVFVEPKKCLTL